MVSKVRKDGGFETIAASETGSRAGQGEQRQVVCSVRTRPHSTASPKEEVSAGSSKGAEGLRFCEDG